MQKSRFWIALIALSFILLGCNQAPTQKLRIAVAANAEALAQTLADEFSATRDVEIDIITGSSGKLTNQISNGAPIDIFMAADMSYPQHLYDTDWTTAAPIPYAKGILVVLSQEDFLKSGMTMDGLKSLAIPNPELAPYGRAAKELLEYQELWETVKPNLVYAENAVQAATYVVSGAAEAAITAKSSALQAQQESEVFVLDINKVHYKPIIQGVVIIKRGKLHPFTQDFVDYLLSEAVQKRIKQHGYDLP
ncbi:molybdate ABC transporter substrate-binding protein [Gilvibacter sp.]|uniref:molybdate ABC transporter substrate-binding protein n=1 Tax=Gilvibacter sp. TaxID=2729997 RepID=UPI0025BFF1B9|nr:molybdate ABC transporter substrate-binding protein [Gilvibacter sp.]NQX77606.1 molybdate ABC transporter substrate-binding protein [Gilvibacter sp.]